MNSKEKQSLFNLFPLALFRDKIEITESERKILVNEILIFPSKTMHSTSFNKTSEERISIAADVTLVAKDSTNSENLLPPIDTWDKF